MLGAARTRRQPSAWHGDITFYCASMAQDLLTARQVADLLHMHVKRVQLLARQGKLPTVRHGRRWLFPRAAILSAPADAAGGIDLSARNQLRGHVRTVRSDGLMVEVA